jgi:uncharacterized protein DUF6526
MAQNFENHAKFVPGFHVVVLGIFTINLGWSLYRVAHAFSAESVLSLLLAIAFILLAFYSRIFALTVQDRVIRLEMRLRLLQILPSELRPRISEFNVNQLVALRFAGDAELPALANKVLDEKLNDRKAIKKMIQDWQPDFLRA